MRDRAHPTPALLLRFLQGEASKSENRAVVRHLLAGCRSCVALALPLWREADGRGRSERQPHLAQEGRA